MTGNDSREFLGNSLKKVTTVGESGEIPHFCYLGNDGDTKITGSLIKIMNVIKNKIIS